MKNRMFLVLGMVCLTLPGSWLAAQVKPKPKTPNARAAAAVAVPAKPKSFKRPQLSGADVYVSSIPAGLKVYLAPAPAQIEKNEEGWGKLANKKTAPPSTMEKGNYRGTTPLVARNVVAGSYLVAIEPVDFMVIDEEERYATRRTDPLSKVFTMVLPEPLSFPGGYDLFKKGAYKEGALIYQFDKTEMTAASLIILALDEGLPFKEYDAIYPRGDNFDFDETALLADLLANSIVAGHFTKDDAQDAIALLKRGGKAALSKRDTRVVVEIGPDSKWTITPQIQIRK